MTNDIKISLDLAERLAIPRNTSEGWIISADAVTELRALLAAPVVESQGEVAAHRIIYKDGEVSGWMDGKPVELDLEDVKDGVLRAIELSYTYPPTPVAVPDGWKLVPIEPTELMIRRGDQNYSWSVAKIYKAMIEDAPACLDKVKELNQ